MRMMIFLPNKAIEYIITCFIPVSFWLSNSRLMVLQRSASVFIWFSSLQPTNIPPVYLSVSKFSAASFVNIFGRIKATNLRFNLICTEECVSDGN